MRSRLAGPAVLVLAMTTLAAAAQDPLALARRLYNDGHYDQALTAAQPALANPATASSAEVVVARIHLEQFRESARRADLDAARAAFHAVDPRPLSSRERIEMQVGLAELLYFDDRFGAAAEMLEPVLGATTALGPEAHDRALDWWATAIDRRAQDLPVRDRRALYDRIVSRMEKELERDPTSGPPGYWLAAAARGVGDLDRAWAAASAAWVRAALNRDRGAAVRADIDRLVIQAIIPDRVEKLATRDKEQAAAGLVAEWQAFKKNY